MLTGFLVIAGLSFLILAHEAGHFFAARIFGLKVDEFGFGFPPRIFAKRKGDTEYSLNWLPFGGFVKISGESGEFALKERSDISVSDEDKKRMFFFQPAWKRIVIILAGVLANIILGWLIVSAVFMAGTPPVVVISKVQPNSPAQAAGILSGDVVKNFIKADDFISYVNANRGNAAPITILRGGREISLTVTPRSETSPGEGALGVVLSEGGIARHGFLSALWSGLKQTALIAGFTLVAFYDLLRDLVTEGTLSADVVGPVGIFSIAKQSGQLGLIYLLQLLSLISINLAVINLIPFPALDGGRFFMILFEKLKGSPVSRRVETMVNGVGFLLLILLMLAITVRDVARWL